MHLHQQMKSFVFGRRAVLCTIPIVEVANIIFLLGKQPLRHKYPGTQANCGEAGFRCMSKL